MIHKTQVTNTKRSTTLNQRCMKYVSALIQSLKILHVIVNVIASTGAAS